MSTVKMSTFKSILESFNHFQLPAVIDCGVTVVVCPLVSLMVDQVIHLKNLGVSFLEFHFSFFQLNGYFSLDSCGAPKWHD